MRIGSLLSDMARLAHLRTRFCIAFLVASESLPSSRCADWSRFHCPPRECAIAVEPSRRIRCYVDGEVTASVIYPLFLAHGHSHVIQWAECRQCFHHPTASHRSHPPPPHTHCHLTPTATSHPLPPHTRDSMSRVQPMLGHHHHDATTDGRSTCQGRYLQIMTSWARNYGSGERGERGERGESVVGVVSVVRAWWAW